VERAREVLEVGLACAAGPKGDVLGPMSVRASGARDRVFVDIHPDVKRASLVQG
jgi:hypothetical protein